MFYVVYMILLLIFSSLVFADAIGIPNDKDCPAGSRLYASHEGVWCVLTVCESDDDCYEGEFCQSVALCVSEGKVVDSCDENICSVGECMTDNRCVTQDGSTNMQTTSGCAGCSSTKFSGLFSIFIFGVIAFFRQTNKQLDSA